MKPNLSKEFQAGKEADRCKKLMGALRYLYRNSFWALLLVSQIFQVFSFVCNLFDPFCCGMERSVHLSGGSCKA